MKLLLDTHIILWSIAETDKLLKEVRNELENEANELWFSPISIWEILILEEKGRIVLGQKPQQYIQSMFQKLPLKEAVINKEVVIQSRNVDLPHQDPSDRFISATAMVYGLTLVTADKRLIGTKQFPVLSNR